jgi:hypothetical protein
MHMMFLVFCNLLEWIINEARFLYNFLIEFDFRAAIETLLSIHNIYHWGAIKTCIFQVRCYHPLLFHTKMQTHGTCLLYAQ